MLYPRWPAPPSVKSLSVTKLDSVFLYQEKFKSSLLTQVHEAMVINLPNTSLSLVADGAYTKASFTPCVIKTADCLAILLCDEAGTEVAALHGGWRGLAKGIIANGIAKFKSSPEKIMAWLSPAICVNHYEIGLEVYETFCGQEGGYAPCFIPVRPGHWLFNLTQLAQVQLQQLGVQKIYTEHLCTFENPEQFYSYRREPGVCGRLMHAVWLEAA